MSSLQFHTLTVSRVEPLTDEAVAISFDVPAPLSDEFSYLPGQHVTIKADINGMDIRRSYSICANAARGDLRVGIKKLGGGVFSTYATEELAAGDQLEVMAPVGEFTITPDPAVSRHYGAITAGSGITPVLSLVSTTLELEPHSRWTLVYGNRRASSIMFLEELEGLKNRYPDRFQIVHVLSRQDASVPMLSGRIDAEKLEQLWGTVLAADDVDEWFLCGPFEMVEAARSFLRERGAKRIHDELFFAGPIDASLLPPPPVDEAGSVSLSFQLEGRTSNTTMRPDTSILDAAMAVRTELPYSCKGGMCASCKAKVLAGEVRMDKNFALIDSEIEAGYVLTCQAHPLSDEVQIDYDQR